MTSPHDYVYIDEGYMQGGGYILSKKALQKFIEVLLPNATLRGCKHAEIEDFDMGCCLAHYVIFVDCRDEFKQKRFFPEGVTNHMESSYNFGWWYHDTIYYRSPQGGVGCCSETPIAFHHIYIKEMYALEYFIYHVHPFGLDDHSLESLPRKLTFNEIIAASDAPSLSSRFKVHDIYHQLDSSEVYWKKKKKVE